MRPATIDMFDEVDRHLVAFASAAKPVATLTKPAPRHANRRHDPLPRRPLPRDPLPFVAAPPLVPAPQIVQSPHASSTKATSKATTAKAPSAAAASASPAAASAKPLRLNRFDQPTPAIVACVIITALTFGLLLALALHLIFGRETLPGQAAVDAVVARIVAAESRGKAEAKNKRSTATGPAQFIDDTWLEMIRAYRPDLVKTRTRDQLLALRNKPELAREMATRFAQRNAAILDKRQLPVTAGTIYLAHFAGPAGAAALLSAPPDADAAKVMADADSTGKTKREQIARANPFLDKFTVADIRRWADRKMDGPRLALSALLSPGK
jgi:hypothetical protein